MIEEGMDIARLNFSHGTHAQHEELIHRLRKVTPRSGRPLAILQDLEGPRIRIGSVKEGSIDLKTGQKFLLTHRQVEGDAHAVSMSYPELPEVVQSGDPILLNDGTVELRVEETSGADVVCQVITGGMISSHKGINLPTRSVTIPAFTEKDRHDLEFGVKAGVDFVALSFVKEASDIEKIKQELERQQYNIPVIAKIERHEALKNLEGILEAADAVMVARGDLGIEIALHKVPFAQKEIIRKANEFGKPVITATQMLRSMVESLHPTRAEVNDVANAVMDGSDAVMLSEETAVGRYPVQAVAMMNRIVEATESELPPRLFQGYRRAGEAKTVDLSDAACAAGAEAARSIGAKGIVVFTQSGNTARLIAKYRPKAPILAFTPNEVIRRKMALLWGVLPLQMDLVEEVDRMFIEMETRLRETEWASPGDRIVILFGFPIDRIGPTNMIKIHVVD
jgi:pyruvate kinase